MIKYLFTTLFAFALVFTGGLGAAFANHGNTDVDCSDFDTGEEVMEFWMEHGYSSENDPMDLDRGDNPLPCENLTEDLNPADYAAEPDTDDAEEAAEETTEEASETEEETTEAAPSTDDDSDDRSAVSDDTVEEEAAEEGGELADTATTTPSMLALGLSLMAAGGIFFARRKLIG